MKRKADNSYKARLVAQGRNQVLGLDCGSTFASVCRLQSVGILVAITVEYDLDTDHMDVSTAFLYADIQEKVFVEQAPGFVVKDKDGAELVMQLENGLYGLAQSLRELVTHHRPRPCRYRIRTAHVRHMRVSLQPRGCQDHLDALRRRPLPGR